MGRQRVLIAVVAGFLAGVAQLANAADVEPAYKAAPVVPVYTWSGCYIGLQVGAGALQDGYTGAVNPSVVNPSVGTPTANVQNQWGFGGLAGGQFGCNYQFGRFVAGIEAETWGSSLQTQSNLTTFGVAQKATTSNRWDFDLTGRAGLAFDQFLLYTKAGVVWGSFKYNYTSFAAAQSGASISPGFLWGVGVEYALMPQWTLRVETDILLFSGTNVNLACTGCVGPNATVSTISAYETLFKVGANYKF
jgi:outer membrane immunogenic protein